jgi:actin-related protein 3
MFKDFGKRLQRDIKRFVTDRTLASSALASKKTTSNVVASEVEVNVLSHRYQRYAVWFGGSLLADTPDFHTYCHTKAEYEEQGPRIARYNRVFGKRASEWNVSGEKES